MLKWFAAFFCFIGPFLAVSSTQAQDIAAGVESVRIEAGAGAMYLRTDYTQASNQGVAFWADCDFRRHLGLEAEGRLGGIISPDDIGENSYLFGPRAILRRHRYAGYAKVMVGRATIVNQELNRSSSFNVYAFGGGLEYTLTRKLTVRIADVEIQKWPDFLPHTLSPLAVTIGMSYVIR